METRFADVYKAPYFEHHNLRDSTWLQLWASHADRIIRSINPGTVLDAGCARGLLVEALRERGVEAYGVDISEYAIGEVRDDIKPYCWVAPLTQPFPHHYDLIVCHEVLEHLPGREAEQAIVNLCNASNDLLIGTTPGHFHDPTHVNVQPPEYWATLFAELGFFHDVDYDASFLSPWAKRFRKNKEPLPRVIGAYERKLWRLTQEVDALRGVALAASVHAIPQAQVDPEAQHSTPGVAALVMERDQLRARLASIEGRLSWQLLNRAWHLQMRIAPPRTLRGRMWLSFTRRVRSRIKPVA